MHDHDISSWVLLRWLLGVFLIFPSVMGHNVPPEEQKYCNVFFASEPAHSYSTGSMLFSLCRWSFSLNALIETADMS